MAFSSIFAMGCGGNACDDAADKAEECGLTSSGGSGDSGDVECTGTVECAANCIVDAPCDAFDGSNADASTAYLECVTGCSGSGS
ncbi:hypothetical protein [Chondromyces crocatus]|nr:hypothetical protein [Chondromyces crocatus]